MPETAKIETYDPKTANLLSFHDSVPAFVDGSDTPRAYLERGIETIEAREPDLKAFVTLNLAGAREAADASTARYKDGRPLSELDGLPVALKDVHETEDMPMQVGSPIYEGWSSGWDGAIVYWLRKCGAAIVGKTVTTEFAFATPGPSRNPWDTSRTPGGSSSGSGAAVGGRMVPIATGSQVRGSILRPAAYCGAYTLKASFGAINPGGGFPSAPSLIHVGFIAGTLADLWTTSHCISHTGGAPRDTPASPGPAPCPGPTSLNGWCVSIRRGGRSPLTTSRRSTRTTSDHSPRRESKSSAETMIPRSRNMRSILSNCATSCRSS